MLETFIKIQGAIGGKRLVFSPYFNFCCTTDNRLEPKGRSYTLSKKELLIQVPISGAFNKSIKGLASVLTRLGVLKKVLYLPC